MHRVLFEKSDEWANDDAEQMLVALAEQLPLDIPPFLDCFNSRKGLERVLQDLYDAQGVIRSTPTFIILQDGRGATLRGA
ncbi:MAG: DsbA family protein [Gammaproteobacteria bacterium]|nr:DsbA family protein [Gammaproteobacteria bacterium]